MMVKSPSLAAFIGFIYGKGWRDDYPQPYVNVY